MLLSSLLATQVTKKDNGRLGCIRPAGLGQEILSLNSVLGASPGALCSVLSSSVQEGDKEFLEKYQQRATKLIRELEHLINLQNLF